MQPSGDVHQTADVSSDDQFGPRCFDAAEFGLQHRRGDLGEFDREQTAEPAAFVGAVHVAAVHGRRVEQFLGQTPQVQVAQTVTGTVHRCGHVGRSRVFEVVVGEEAGQLHDPSSDASPGCFVGSSRQERRRVVDQHVGTRPGGDDDGAFGSVEDGHRVRRHRCRLVGVPGVESGLSATGLIEGELDLVSRPFQESDGGDTDLRGESIDQTRDEELAGARHAFDVSHRYGADPMQTPHDSAIDRLIASDPALAAVVVRAGRPRPFRRAPTFETLVLLILEQQVSLDSARAAFRRLTEVTKVDPAGVLALDDDTMRRAGFSRQKARYVQLLAEAVDSGSFDLAALADLPDEEARARLLSLTGIGPWTADVFLLSCLERPDIWPVGDRALQVGVGEVLDLDTTPTPTELESIGIRWRPFRSTAAQLVWHDYLHRRGRRDS